MTHGYGRRICALGIVLIGLLASCITGREEGKTEVNKWENDIKTFEAWDAKNSFPKDAVLFAGSSSIRMWDTAKLFAEYPVINRGFGGSQISDMNLYVERIVLPYKPKVIVFYCGVNDIVGGGEGTGAGGGRFQAVPCDGACRPARDAGYLFVDSAGAGMVAPHHPRTDRVNASVRELADKLDYLHYADVTTGMMGDDGTPEPSLFLDDKIHLTSEGNAKWADCCGRH